jgi:hypothetical protein
MPHARWKDEESETQPTGGREFAQRFGTAISNVSGTAWALGALLVGAASAGAAFALRRQPTPRRKTRGRAKVTRRRVAAA